MSDRSPRLTREVRELFDEYCNNLIEPDRLARLERLLIEDAELVREFVAYFHLHSQLHFVMRAERASGSVLRLIADDPNPNPNPTPYSPGRPSPRWLRSRRIATAGAAAVLLIGAGAWLGTLGRRETSRTSTPPVVARSRPKADLETGLAMVVKLVGVQWEAGDDPPPAEGDLLPPGHLRFRSGRVTLSMLTGVSIDLEGPADLELLSDEKVFCHKGRLRARVPEGSEGFVVSGPGAAVIDMGTEFGLNVDPDGTTRGKVFQGKVEAALTTRTGVYRRSRIINDKGRPFEINPRVGSIEADTSPEDFVRRADRARPALELDPGYPAAVLHSRPRAYWRFGAMADGAIPSEVPGGPALKVVGPLHLSAKGPGRDNTSLVFDDGAPEQYLEMDGPWKPARRPGHAVELWFQPDAIGHLTLASMITADSPRSGVTDPARLRFSFLLELTSSMRTRLHQPASVRLLHRFPAGYWGGDNLYSSLCYVPSRWHHLVGQLNDDRMELYLDAEPTAPLSVDPGYTSRPVRLLLGRLTTLPGDPGRNIQAYYEHTSRPFVGQIDEVAIYDRPLSVEEIRLHHRLASRGARP